MLTIEKFPHFHQSFCSIWQADINIALIYFKFDLYMSRRMKSENTASLFRSKMNTQK